MNASLSRSLLLSATVAIALAGANGVARAADVTRDDILVLFTMKQVDKDHDTMVSKKEFLDMMSKAWDMEASSMKAKDRMTLEQYRAFTAMFNLNVGG